MPGPVWLYLLLGLHACRCTAALEQPSDRPLKGAPACSASKQRLDCGLFRPLGEASCRSAGCCWDDSKEPHCFFSNDRPVPKQDGVQVHLFEWSWADVKAECEWLGKAGYTGVQVSPPHEDVTVRDYPDSHTRQEPWWTRYQPVSYQLASRSGNESEFTAMVQHCRKHGVDIYVDVVINHMAGGKLTDPRAVGRAGTPWQYRKFYGNLYNSTDFHHREGEGFSVHGNCQIQDQDFHSCYDCVQQCDLGGLADLDTSMHSVQGKIAEYLNRLAQLGVAGVRVDAAKHMNSWDMGSILQGVNSSLYVYQEVLEGCNELVTAEEYTSLGQVIEFRWAQMVFDRFFTARDLHFLGSEYLPCGHLPSDRALVFVENHDRQSNCHVKDFEAPCASLTVPDGDIYKVAVAFTLAYPYGSPQILSSYAYSSHVQGAPKAAVHKGNGSVTCGSPDAWYCQHRWPEISGMVRWRRSAADRGISHWWLSDSHQQVQFSRGSTAMIFINIGKEAFRGKLYDTKLPAGKYCNAYKEGCEGVKIIDDGSTSDIVVIASDSVLALHADSVRSRDLSSA